MAYVFDSTAILALLLGEPESPHVTNILRRVQSEHGQLFIPFIALMEVRYRLLRDYPGRAEAAERIIESLPGSTVESDPQWRERAARLKARGGLSLADAWIASLAIMHDAELVHKDPEFDRVEGLRSYPLR